jgi:tyrosinase
MLHHCNVDRLWAYWQAIVPEHGIFQIPYLGGSRFSTPRGTVIGPDSPLQPFYKTSGDFHTTRSVEKIENFGYSYIGLEYWEKTTEEMKQDSKKLVNRLYGPDNSEALREARRSGNRRHRYFLRVQLERSEVEAPCQVKFCLRNIEVGSMVVMEQPTEGVIHGAFSIDNAMELYRMGSDNPKQTVQMIESNLEVLIVKVRRGIKHMK